MVPITEGFKSFSASAPDSKRELPEELPAFQRLEQGVLDDR